MHDEALSTLNMQFISQFFAAHVIVFIESRSASENKMVTMHPSVNHDFLYHWTYRCDLVSHLTSILTSDVSLDALWFESKH